TKIVRKRSSHQMLASIPASILNHNPNQMGIPLDSAKTGNALEHFPPKWTPVLRRKWVNSRN
ncbi:MAG: hypothetical protein AB7U61_06885, partial [Methylocystis sp.]